MGSGGSGSGLTAGKAQGAKSYESFESLLERTMDGIGSEWKKDNMHRFYIDLQKAADVYYNNDDTEHARLYLNGRERSGGKLWYDYNTGEFETKRIDSPEIVVAQIKELIRLRK